MPKKDRISDKDKALFRESMRDVRRIKSDKVDSEQPKKGFAKKSRHTQKNARQQKQAQRRADELHDISMEHADPAAQTTSDEVLRYALIGVDQKTLLRLKKAKFPIHANLDLHGLTVNQARLEVVEFIHHYSCQYRRCVCIIHGKSTRTGGHSILKSQVNHWLRQMPEVVAFHSAPARFGGSGALLVLIKSRE